MLKHLSHYFMIPDCFTCIMGMILACFAMLLGIVWISCLRLTWDRSTIPFSWLVLATAHFILLLRL